MTGSDIHDIGEHSLAREHDRHFRPLVQFAVDIDSTTVQLDKSFAYRQPQAGSFLPGDIIGARADKLPENVREVLLGYPDACIGDPDKQLSGRRDRCGHVDVHVFDFLAVPMMFIEDRLIRINPKLGSIFAPVSALLRAADRLVLKWRPLRRFAFRVVVIAKWPRVHETT